MATLPIGVISLFNQICNNAFTSENVSLKCICLHPFIFWVNHAPNILKLLGFQTIVLNLACIWIVTSFCFKLCRLCLICIQKQTGYFYIFSHCFVMIFQRIFHHHYSLIEKVYVLLHLCKFRHYQNFLLSLSPIFPHTIQEGIAKLNHPVHIHV